MWTAANRTKCSGGIITNDDDVVSAAVAVRVIVNGFMVLILEIQESRPSLEPHLSLLKLSENIWFQIKLAVLSTNDRSWYH